MAKYGLLIDLDRCIGCRTHEVVCKTEGNEIVRQPLVSVSRVTPDGEPVLQYLHFVQARCGLSRSCAGRVGKGLAPRCVAACQAGARQFGRVEELFDYARAKNIPHCTIIPF
ncbi:MAG: hypothetical protein HY673_06875 [Chloroflexi bacterium]|nr:hypothetical protein [Chloroflexota bacterium]